MHGVNVRIDQQNRIIIQLQGDNSRLQQQVEDLKFELASKKDQEAELKSVRGELEALKGRVNMLFAGQPAQPTHQPQSSPAPSTSTAATEKLKLIPKSEISPTPSSRRHENTSSESGMTEHSENVVPAQTQTSPPPSQGLQECARARPFDRGHCPIKIEPQEANEVTKEELTLAKRRLSDDMDISSGSDDSDSDRTIPFVKGRPSTDQHNEAVTENAHQSVYNGPVLQSPVFQEKRHPPVLPRIPKKAPTAGVSQINDESRASSSSVDSEKRQKPAERTESANPISTPVLNDLIPTSSNEASKDPCAKPKEVPPPIPRPPIGKIPLLPPVRPTIKPAVAAPQPVPPPWGNLWRPIQPPRPTETASARGILDQILESQTSQSFSPPETIESRRIMLKRLASNETDPSSSPDSVTAAKRWRHEDSSTDDPQMGNQSPATVPSTSMVPPSSNFLAPFPQPGLIDESAFLTVQQKKCAKWGREIEALLPPEREEPLPTKREDLIRLKDELENEIPKYGREPLRFQHRLEHFTGICFFCKASRAHPSTLCPVIKRLDVRQQFLDLQPDFCRLCLRMKVKCQGTCIHPCRFCRTASQEKTGACNDYTNPRVHNSALCPLPFERQKKEILLQRVEIKLWEMNLTQPDTAAASTSLNNSQLAFLQPFTK
ncbi:hypothetical protein WR25_27311 [Diploscapter pachys]|uniref:Uncharacterized protein n=1 Tax=Diploscapter pachys TaxID=2018661 RepID=A0A2A2K6B1_9BILA|nr:hypothetical protein WR25_27311 [Diploscapter pachys]